MNKHLRLTLILTIIIFFSFNTYAEESKDSACKDITLASLQTHVPIPPATILSKQSVNGICEVILDINGQYVPVYAGKSYVIAGEMFQDKMQVTQTRLDNLKAQNFIRLKPDIEKCVAMSYAPKGQINNTIYMITDPVCPFCHQAESQLKEFAETHTVKIKIIFASVHPPVGRQKAVEAVCRNFGFDNYINSNWRDENKTDQYQCQTGIDLINASEKISAQLGIDGVPVFFLENGQRVDGADMTALANVLGDFSATVSDAK